MKKDIGKYVVYSDGKVWSKISKKFLKQTLTNSGYYILGSKLGFVHRLIVKTFIGKIPNGFEVNHKDGNKLNNSIDNLEWCSYKRNADHMFNTGLREDNIRIKAIFNEDDTVMIFRSKAKARKYLKLSEKALNKGIDNGEIKGIQIKVIDKI